MIRSGLALLLALGASHVAASDFRSIGEAAAILYDAPSLKAVKVAVAGRNLPVEVIASDGTWVKVRDPGGELAWVEKKALSEKRTVVVSVPVAEVRQKPEDAAPLAFQAQQGVLLELVELGAAGWVRVRHRDGSTGFVRVQQIWGV